MRIAVSCLTVACAFAAAESARAQELCGETWQKRPVLAITTPTEFSDSGSYSANVKPRIR